MMPRCFDTLALLGTQRSLQGVPSSAKRVPRDEEKAMKCGTCRQGEAAAGHATLALERGSTGVIIKRAPAEVCGNCGEYYLDETVAERVFAQAEDAVRRQAEIEVLRYAA